MFTYENHVEGALEQLKRKPRALPKLVYDEALPDYLRDRERSEDATFRPELIEALEPGQVKLEGYNPHPSLKFEMVV